MKSGTVWAAEIGFPQSAFFFDDAMPIYEYQCTACNERHEIIHRFSDAPATHCPKCGGDLKKLISSPAIQFKGSGFYKTDYPSSSSSAPAATKSTPAATEAAPAKTETKSESKD